MQPEATGGGEGIVDALPVGEGTMEVLCGRCGNRVQVETLVEQVVGCPRCGIGVRVTTLPPTTSSAPKADEAIDHATERVAEVVDGHSSDYFEDYSKR